VAAFFRFLDFPLDVVEAGEQFREARYQKLRGQTFMVEFALKL